MVLLVTVPTPPLSARCACAQHEPFVCFTLGFSALLAPLALLALQVHSCVNFPAKKSQSASRPPPGQQTPVCVIALLLQALVSEPRRVKNKNTHTNIQISSSCWKEDKTQMSRLCRMKSSYSGVLIHYHL